MALYSCKVTNNVDVWDAVDGRVIGHIRSGATVIGQAPSGGWVQLNMEVNGHNPVWTRERLLAPFNYKPISSPPPSPPPPQVPVHTIDIFPDGKISVDHGNPY